MRRLPEVRVKLYYFPGSCALAPHIVAREAALDVAIEKVNTQEMRTETGADYRAIAPKGYVPVLELNDGALLTEAAVIVQYLADQKPEANLTARFGTMERYRQMEWLNYIATELHKLFTPLIKGGAEETKQQHREKLAEQLDYVSKQLEGRDYLLGAFSVCDAYLYTVLSWTRFIKYDTARWPRVQEYLKRVRERPGVQQAMSEQGLLKSAPRT
jgi:glutathione S-transferase